MNLKYLSIFALTALLAISCGEKKTTDTNENKSVETISKNTTAQNTTTQNTTVKEDTKKEDTKSDAIDHKNVTVVKSFLEARNTYDAKKLRDLTFANYKELFNNDVVEINSQKEFLAHLEWAKELSSKTTIEKVISANDETVVVIEATGNYIDVAFKRNPRKFVTTYYVKDGKILKQSFNYGPDEKFDQSANDVLYGNFERFCKVRDIPFSWEPTKEDGIVLRNALEKYANRKE